MIKNLKRNISLKPYNTFAIEAKAKYFTDVFSISQLKNALQFAKENNFQFKIISGGSNVLFVEQEYEFIIHILIGGIEKTFESEYEIHYKVGAGVKWHTFVKYCVNKGLGGIENLSLIPGSVGASPMQNIGAYGVEIKDVFKSLTALEISTGQLKIFSLNDCKFGYRESVFKNELKNKFIIIDVTYKLLKIPKFNISYGALSGLLEKKELSVSTISDAVISIRQSKLPDPSVIGNAGSFFKNPEVSNERFNKLKEKYPEIPSYNLENGNVKIPAGWLIETCDWKGFRKNDAGCHKHQALVLVNYGSATGNEILDLSDEIVSSVKQKFGIELQKEVNILK